VTRFEDDWPIPRTRWTRWFLHPDGRLDTTPSESQGRLEFEALGDGLCSSRTFDEDLEITGPSSLQLTVASPPLTPTSSSWSESSIPTEAKSSSGCVDPIRRSPRGWLRAHALDPERSLPWRPWHPHDRIEPLTPGALYTLEIEIWPTSIVIPQGHRLSVTVRGSDYAYRGTDTAGVDISTFKNRFTGCGPFVHDDPDDRDREVFGGITTLVLGPDAQASLLAPVIPSDS
jgi:predicted acyl esterase